MWSFRTTIGHNQRTSGHPRYSKAQVNDRLVVGDHVVFPLTLRVVVEQLCMGASRMRAA